MKHLILSLALLASFQAGAQGVLGFEEEVPANFKAGGKKSLSLSGRYHKEGLKSLEWQFQPGEMLTITPEQPLKLNDKTEKTYGITLWIYNEEAAQDSLCFEFLNAAGEVSYRFSYHLASAGWRACWMGFKTMHGSKADKTIASYRIIAPQRKGRVYLDRWKFPEKKMNLRTTPDLQVRDNCLAEGRDMWHWGRLWEWEQYEYDFPRPEQVTDQQKKDLKAIEEYLDETLAPPSNVAGAIKKARNLLKKVAMEKVGDGYRGMPILTPDELKRKNGEISWNDLEAMLTGLAYESICNKTYEGSIDYIEVWRYALNQGFAYGSGMGTNHHYGYQVRKLYATAWLMRRTIAKSSIGDEILKTLLYWSALQETRHPCAEIRDEMLDSWNTLLQPKLIAAMMQPDDRDRVQALQGLTRWVCGSIKYTPGTIGGLKPDGTTFHHGGFYPGYTTGALATLAQYIAATTGTQFVPTEEARRILAQAFRTMRNYSNLHEWNTGIGGRHPFTGKMGTADIEAFAQLAMAGDLTGNGDAFDRTLAADYLRLINGKNTKAARYFKEQGVEPAQAPQGFFVYNYGAAGIMRRGDWMVTLKGYNTNVWGSEIYTKDNRYGRYQSYGSVQIMGKKSRKASGYVEEGWDWNRLPGTTTLHLPFDLLENPRKGTLMARSPEEFAGTSSLEGMNGMMAIKLREADYENFTPDFRARKSAFCFDNRIICLGSNINTSNNQYATETTLFQSEYRPGKAVIALMGTEIDKPTFGTKMAGGPQCWLRDGYGNHYHVAEGLVRVQVSPQQSRHNKTKAETNGHFASAFLIHGAAPKEAAYHYSILIQPTPEQLEAAKQNPGYQVLQRDSIAHVVHDDATGITAYAIFEDYRPEGDEAIAAIPAETMVMRRTAQDGTLIMSVCDPNLHIKSKTYTTPEPSAPFVKTVTLKGNWTLSQADDRVQLSTADGQTTLNVTCQHGIPVEFQLKKQ